MTTTIVKWVLRRGHAALACEVDMHGDRSFDVRVLPSSSTKPIVEHFAAAVPAMKRHAEIAGFLRDEGWRVTERARFVPHESAA